MDKNKQSADDGEVKFTSSEATVPPADFQANEAGRTVYLQAQAHIRAVISALGIEYGTSMFVSGFTRELRRHMTVEAAQQLLRQLADTMPEAAKFDAPEPDGTTPAGSTNPDARQ